MRTMAALCVAMCVLHQAVSVSVSDSTHGSRRDTRQTTAPAPIDCKMSAYSAWGPCQPCTKTMHRSRGVEAFGQFDGTTCNMPLDESKGCKTDTVCEEEPKPACSNTEFQCESGMCIKKRLMCNGDGDCGDGDFSDEDTCEKEGRRPCGKLELDPSETGRNAGNGINILGMRTGMNPFNNDLFNGMCTRVRDPSTLEYKRLPWNVAVLSYETLVDESTSKEIYEDTYSLLKEIMKETTDSLGVGLSFKFTPTAASNASVSVQAGVDSETKNKKMIKQVTEYSTTKNKSFIRVKGKVQVNTYRMRSSRLIVSEKFLEDIANLPTEYEKGQYFRFLEGYGTHYTMNGKSGGEYELVYVLNQDVIKTMKVTEQMLQDCIKVGVTAEVQVAGGFKAGGHVRPSKCNSLTTPDKDLVERKAVIDKVITVVSGGSPAAALAMKTQINKDSLLDVSIYQEWARTITELPVLIHSQPEAIYTLIPLTVAGADAKRENVQRALEEYVAEYNVCKCQPCHNGGTVSQMDGKCICLCPLKYKGVACQDIRSELLTDKEPVVQQGNWGCWSGWTGCVGGSHSRSRTCNTKGLSGASCRGDTVSTDYC